MQNYPDQVTEATRNHADRLVMSQARNEATIHDLENASLAFNAAFAARLRMRRIWRLPLGECRLRFAPALSSLPGHAPTHEESFLADAKVAALAPTSAMICCA
jgi:hypothetical protein